MHAIHTTYVRWHNARISRMRGRLRLILDSCCGRRSAESDCAVCETALLTPLLPPASSWELRVGSYIRGPWVCVCMCMFERFSLSCPAVRRTSYVLVRSQYYFNCSLVLTYTHFKYFLGLLSIHRPPTIPGSSRCPIGVSIYYLERVLYLCVVPKLEGRRCAALCQLM